MHAGLVMMLSGFDQIGNIAAAMQAIDDLDQIDRNEFGNLLLGH